jgi:HK97 family phage major capsid protein
LQNYYQFGQGMLNAWTVVVGPFLASLQLIQDSGFDVDRFVAERIGEALGRSIAAISVSGTGSGQPLGIITALNAKGALSGASGGYYQLTAGTTVKTFAAANPTELSGNLLAPTSLLGMIAGVDPAYYPTAKWYMNAVQAWNLRSVVDSNGRPLINFANGFDADAVTGPGAKNWSSNTPVARLFGFPVVIDNNIPNLTASTTGGPVFGALDHAMVYRVVRNDARIVADMNTGNMMRLTERYADLLAVGYLGYIRTDVRSNDLRAAATVKAAAT